MRLSTWLYVAGTLLAVKVLLSILWQYRWYFPPDFNAPFLIGRRYTFTGLYRLAFFTHLTVSPLVLVACGGLWVIGKHEQLRQQPLWRRVHRWGGRSMLAVLVLLMTPSGWVLAGGTHGGPLVAWGFYSLTIMTLVVGCMVARSAWKRVWHSHQRWATRLLALLLSPLLLRLMSGVAIVTKTESVRIYAASSWASWLLPLLICETIFRVRWRKIMPDSQRHQPRQSFAAPISQQFASHSHES